MFPVRREDGLPESGACRQRPNGANLGRYKVLAAGS